MQRVSSNLTLFFKFFVPIFWAVLFGAITIAVWFGSSKYFGGVSLNSFRLGVTFFYLTGLALFVFTLLPLKRVEMDEHFAYVTNYFKASRYPWHNVEAIYVSRFFLLSMVTLELRERGQFGKRIRFIGSQRLFRDFMEEHPEVKELVK